MTQSDDATREDTGDARRLPSVVPAAVELTHVKNEQLAIANEFFSSLDADRIVVPEQPRLSLEADVVRAQAATVPSDANVKLKAVAELDTSLEDDLDEALTDALGSDLQKALPPPVIKKMKVPKAIPMARRARKRVITIQEREDEPFQFRELLTWKGVKRHSSFLVSLFLHTLLLLFLSLLVVRNGIGDSTLFLDLAEAPADEGMLEEINVNPVMFNEDEVMAEVPLNELLSEVLEKEDAEKDVLKVEEFKQADGPIGGGASSARGSQGDGKSAMFFGTKASGRSFVFVVDRSTSMQYGSRNFVSRELFNRYDVAKSELLNAIESLQPHQEFFVLMFAHNTIPMFSSKSVEQDGDQEYRMIAATPQNKARFQGWLEGVGMGPGTDPRHALEIAIEMQPDSIFMLSDGAFVSERNDDRPKTREIIQQYISAGLIVPINTTSLVVEETIPTMKSIADKSGGLFKFTTINDYIKQIGNLRGPMRSRALEQLIVSADDGWDSRREIIVEKLLPMLAERSSTERASAESLLHRATMGLFKGHLDSVFQPGGNATQHWNDVVREIDGYFRTKQVTALGQGREVQQKILLSMLELEDDSYIQLFENLDMDRVSSLTMIEMVHGIDRGHLKFGTSPESIGWLRYLIARLNGKKPKERSELGRIDWSIEQAQAAMDRLFETRLTRAQAMYRKYKDPDKGLNIRERLGKAIVSMYPETKEAGRVRLELELERAEDFPVSTDGEGDSLEEMFGQ